MCEIEDIKTWFLQHPFVKQDYKEEWDAFRFLLHDKMFAMLCVNKDGTPIVTLKLPPQEGAFYREQFSYITPGYYMNKVHWISIEYSKIEPNFLQDIIAQSYTHFIKGLPKQIQKEFEANTSR